MYTLRSGSTFEYKCDVMILPSDNYGGTAHIVNRDLETNKLMVERNSIGVGNVEFKVVAKEFDNASVLGLAASVDSTTAPTSSIEIVKRIMRQIIDYCSENKFSIVNVPLLGSGSGRLSKFQSFEAIVALCADSPNIMVNICTYSKRIFDLLEDKYRYTVLNDQNIKNPRVFISYTQNENVNGGMTTKEWAEMLTNKLRTNGVDARIDAFDLHPGNFLPQWMTNEIIMADKVLMICDSKYAAKADGYEGGVGWETMIIQGAMLMNLNTNKFISIARDDVSKSLPIYMQSRYSYVWKTDEIEEANFNDLLHCIFDIDPAYGKKLGKIPLDILEKLKAKD